MSRYILAGVLGLALGLWLRGDGPRPAAVETESTTVRLLEPRVFRENLPLDVDAYAKLGRFDRTLLNEGYQHPRVRYDAILLLNHQYYGRLCNIMSGVGAMIRRLENVRREFRVIGIVDGIASDAVEAFDFERLEEFATVLVRCVGRGKHNKVSCLRYERALNGSRVFTRVEGRFRESVEWEKAYFETAERLMYSDVKYNVAFLPAAHVRWTVQLALDEALRKHPTRVVGVHRRFLEGFVDYKSRLKAELGLIFCVPSHVFLYDMDVRADMLRYTGNFTLDERQTTYFAEMDPTIEMYLADERPNRLFVASDRFDKSGDESIRRGVDGRWRAHKKGWVLSDIIPDAKTRFTDNEYFIAELWLLALTDHLFMLPLSSCVGYVATWRWALADDVRMYPGSCFDGYAPRLRALTPH